MSNKGSMKCEEIVNGVKNRYIWRIHNFKDFLVTSEGGFSSDVFTIKTILKFKLLKRITFNERTDSSILPLLVKKFWLRRGWVFSFRWNYAGYADLFGILKDRWLPRNFGLAFNQIEENDEWIESLAELIKSRGFVPWVSMNVRKCPIWDNWIKKLAAAIKETWFQERMKFLFTDCDIGDAGLMAWAEIIQEKWLKKWMKITCHSGRIGDTGIIWLCEAISVFWFEEWVWLNFNQNPIGDTGALCILELIKSKGLKKWMKIHLPFTSFSGRVIDSLKEEVQKQWFDPQKVFNL